MSAISASPENVLVVGAGGREAVLADVLARHAASVVVAPGNPTIPGSNQRKLSEMIDDGSVSRFDLVVIGSENDLVDGQADLIRALGVQVLGPGADGAKLEGSKAFMKEVVEAAGVPTATYREFDTTQLDEALRFVRNLLELHGLVVVKTDYLMGGKGVLVSGTYQELVEDIRTKLTSTKANSYPRVIIEEPLDGPEVSVFAVCDGYRSVCLPAAQDYKRLLDGDAGPNTGGMGAYSPVPFLPDGFEVQIDQEFIQPTLAELRSRGIDFRGVLYAGLMLTADGPKLLEYNIRFGDPDSQVVLLRLDPGYDLGAMFLAAAEGDLARVPLPEFISDAKVLVVKAAAGYPTEPRVGHRILGIPSINRRPDVHVYGAGVARNATGDLVSAGGRVLNIVGTGSTLELARDRAYRAERFLGLPGGHVRTDIGLPH